MKANIKIVISVFSIVFFSENLMSQNFIYEQKETKKTNENLIINEKGEKKLFIDILEVDLINSQFVKPASKESFLIIDNNIDFSNFSLEELILINSNRNDYYSVRTEINNKKVIILPK